MPLSSDPRLELLYERAGLPRFDLPAALLDKYAGALGFERPCLFANFVSSLDGVVALPVEGDSGPVISQHSQTDHFVMGMLRACAEAVIVGAGTFRKASGHVWNADTIYPPGAELFAETRARLGLLPQPQLVIVTHSGELDLDQPAIEGALIATSRAGQAKLRGRVPGSTEILTFDSEPIRTTELLPVLHQRGLRLLLTEGGPSLFAQMVSEDVLDELFLTSSPLLFGRTTNDHRKSLADGLDLGGATLELLSARRDGSYLFLRYARAR
jgi:riboflavin biosynthesis pyrimidine reductase